MGGVFIGLCILLSGRSVSVIQVEGVFFAVTGERFREIIWGYKVGSGDSFMVMGDLFMVPFAAIISKKVLRALLSDSSLSFVVRRRKWPTDSDSFVSSMIVKKGIPFMSLIVLIILGNVCGLPR